MNILAIETSCDESACAVVRDGRKILSNIIATQMDTHALFGGVVPEIASRMHTECISQVANEALASANLSLSEIDALAVTSAPGLIGALLVGVSFAKGLAYSISKPLIAVHHIRSHVAANYLINEKLAPPFVCLIASGGHSHIVYVADYTSYEILGKTCDDAAGEAFDKVARVLSLSYPGGVKIDALSKLGNENAIPFPIVNFAENPYNFSFSGVKTSVINYVSNAKQRGAEINKADIAASFSKSVVSALTTKSVAAVLEKQTRTLCLAGGVAANSMLRCKMQEICDEKGIVLYIPPLSLCGDNAAMVGSQAYYEYLNGNISDMTLNAKSMMSIETLL